MAGFPSRSVLAVGAHPDDAVLGSGLYLVRLAEAGHRVTILTLASGELAGDRETREAEERRAATVIGADVVFGRLPDGGITFERAVSVIQEVVSYCEPDLVLIHDEGDSHQDHRVAASATLVACRQVPCVLTYEGPSSTNFAPSVFVSGSRAWLGKLSALRHYGSQMTRRPFLEWAANAGRFRSWPRYVGLHCEAFRAVHLDAWRFPSLTPEEEVPSLIQADYLTAL